MTTPPPRPVLVNDLVEEVLLRLPPEKPAWLVRASAVCKPWRHILAAPGFRRRYREFHGTPPVLGVFQRRGRFISTSSLLLPAQADRKGWVTLDCRHGRALFSRYGGLVVVDPATGHQRPVPFPEDERLRFSAAVLCAAQGCDHHDCQRGHFLVASVTTDDFEGITSGWLYSSESRIWSKLTSVHHPDVEDTSHICQGSVLVGDALYFNVNGGIIECQLGTLRLSMFEKPIDGAGTIMMAEDGGLGFAAMTDVSNLTLWSRDIALEGSMSMGWEKIRVIDLKTFSHTLRISNKFIKLVTWGISGFAEGTQVIFLTTCLGSCMVDLKSGRGRALSCYENNLFPYMTFYFPAMEAACTGQGQ